MINSHEDLVEFIQRQLPDEEIGIAGPGTWGLLAMSHPGHAALALWSPKEGSFPYFDLDATKIFMSPYAQEGEIQFTKGSFPITGLDFVRI